MNLDLDATTAGGQPGAWGETLFLIGHTKPKLKALKSQTVASNVRKSPNTYGAGRDLLQPAAIGRGAQPKIRPRTVSRAACHSDSAAPRPERERVRGG